MLRPLPWHWFLLLGALLGVVEAAAVVPYDWLMLDWAPARLAAAVAHAVVFVVVNALGWTVLGLVGARRAPVALALGGALLVFARVVPDDRFDEWTLVLPVAALGLSLLASKHPRVVAALAALLGVFTLWGRVPSSAFSVGERLLALLPGLVLVGLAALPGRAALRLGGAAGVLLLPLSLSVAPSRAAPERPPSVLFVLVDTLRVDHVGPYGDRATPSTRRLAAEGLRFDDAITVVPKTTQSVAAFQTGRYPHHSGVRALKDALGPDQTTLAEHLGAAGWRTGAVVHNPWVRRGRGFEQGFGQFWSFYELERAWGPLRYSGLVTALDTAFFGEIRTFDPNTDARVTTDRALAWLDETPDDAPFYLYVHYFDPHWPYRPPGVDAENRVNNIHDTRWTKGDLVFNNPLREAENDEAIGLYGQEIDHNADQIGRLLQWLDDTGRAEDTVVVFTADHGHHLGDHDYWYHHGAFLYEPGLRIPLIVRAPGAVEAGAVHGEQFRSIDLLPTLLDWLDAPPLAGVDGLRLDQLTAGGPPPAFLESDQVFFKANRRRHLRGALGKVRGVRDGRWKLHLTPRDGGGLWELYDLAADPGETTNLVGAVPGDAPVEALLQALRAGIPREEQEQLAAKGVALDRLGAAWEAGTAATPSTAPADPEAGLSEDEADMLRAMGYLD
jgi:arylsulfatase A-like enzyme